MQLEDLNQPLREHLGQSLKNHDQSRFSQRNVWSSQVGDRVSFFIIAGNSTEEIYEGYHQLTGMTHMLPKATYGYIQSKAIYPTQAQLLAVAKNIANADCPLDVLVVDFLNMTTPGEMDLDPARCLIRLP